MPNVNIHNARRSNNIPPINLRQDYFQNLFFLFTIKLDLKIRKSASLSIFKKNLLNFVRS